MEDFLTGTWGLILLFMTACYILTTVTRRIVETAAPSLKKKADANDPALSYETNMSRWWNEVILYALPAVFGLVMSLTLSTSDYMPERWRDAPAAIMFGLSCGFLSGMGYKLLKRAIAQKAGVSLEELEKPSYPPPAGEGSDDPPPTVGDS